VELFCQVTCYNLVDAPLNEDSEAIGLLMEIPRAIDKELRFFVVEKALKTIVY
jgi:hypothetical protein